MPFFPEFVDVVQTTNINDGAVTLVKMADLAQNSVIGRHASAGTGVPEALTQTQLTALLNPASASLPGSLAVADYNKLATVPTLGQLWQYWISPTINFKNTGTTQIAPTGTGRVIISSTAIIIDTITSPTVSPTIRVGTTGVPDAVCPALANSAFLTAVAHGKFFLGATTQTTACADLSDGGIILEVTVGASATALTGRAVFGFMVA